MLKRRHGKIILAAWMMVLPALLIRMSTIVYPFVMTVVNSFQDLNIFKGASGDFIGFANYAKLFTDGKLLDVHCNFYPCLHGLSSYTWRWPCFIAQFAI